MKEEKTTLLLNELASRVPWAIFGFSQQSEIAWRKAPSEFINTVEGRRREFKGKSNAASTSA